MPLLLSQATPRLLAELERKANEQESFIEMRNKYGILLAVATGIRSLTEELDKNGKPLFKVESKKELDYDHINETVTYDIVLDVYQGMNKERFENPFQNPQTQKLFEKQEKYWFSCYKRWKGTKSNVLLGSDVIINRLKY